MPERLIDAEAFEKHIMGSKVFSQYFKELVQSLIWGENTVDAVRVVRCKDCVWFEPKHILHNDGTIAYVAEDAESVTIDVGINCQATCRRYSYIDNLFVSDSGNDYCSRGAKMEDKP